MTTPRQSDLPPNERLILLEGFRAEWQDYATGQKAIPENFGTQLKQTLEEGRTLPLAFSLAYDLILYSNKENKLLPAYEAYCLATLCDPAYPVSKVFWTLKTIEKMSDKAPAVFAQVVRKNVEADRAAHYAVSQAVTFAKEHPEHEALIVSALDGCGKKAVEAADNHVPTLASLLTLSAFHNKPELEQQAARALLASVMLSKAAVRLYDEQAAILYGGPFALNKLMDKALPSFLSQIQKNSLSYAEIWFGQINGSALNEQVRLMEPDLEAKILVRAALRPPVSSTTLVYLSSYIKTGQSAVSDHLSPSVEQAELQRKSRLEKIQELVLKSTTPEAGFTILARLHAGLVSEPDLARPSREVLLANWPAYGNTLSDTDRLCLRGCDDLLAYRLDDAERKAAKPAAVAPDQQTVSSPLARAWRQLTTRLLRSGRGHEKGPSRNGP